VKASIIRIGEHQKGALAVKSTGAVIVKSLMIRFIREDEGQDVIEYALLAAFLVVVVATIISTIGVDLKTIYTNVKTQTGVAAS
jgi:Flp pilus assembly pilin Flp